MRDNLEIYRLQSLWREQFKTPSAPNFGQFQRWLRFHDPKTLAWAIQKTAQRNRFRSMDEDFRIRYVSRCCNDFLYKQYEQEKKTAQEASAA